MCVMKEKRRREEDNNVLEEKCSPKVTKTNHGKGGQKGTSETTGDSSY